MSPIELSVPSKTFLAGEYSVLAGGRGLLLATPPRFRLIAEKKDDGSEATPPDFFHPESPAGVWYRQSRIIYRDYELKFEDPHQGLGGFGGSGAEFTLLHALGTWIQTGGGRLSTSEELLNDFAVCDRSGASGADVATQSAGGVTVYDRARKRAVARDWPFPAVDGIIVRTGHKLNTHEHLRTLSENQITAIKTASEAVVDAFEEPDPSRFVETVRLLQDELIHQKLQADFTQKLIRRLSAGPGVLAAKGCGAMGADTLLLLIDAGRADEFLEFLGQEGLNPVARLKDLAPGLSIENRS